MFTYSYLVNCADMQMVIHFIIIGIMGTTKSPRMMQAKKKNKWTNKILCRNLRQIRVESMCYVAIYDLRKFKNATFCFEKWRRCLAAQACVHITRASESHNSYENDDSGGGHSGGDGGGIHQTNIHNIYYGPKMIIV